MANCMLGFPNRTDQATLSNGSWLGALPQTNLQNRILGKVARTTDASLGSTKIDIDLGVSKKIQVASLSNHNLSVLFAKYRVTASALSDFSVLSYDSGWGDVWPEVYTYGTLEWEDDNFWSGKYTAEQAGGYTAALIHILPTFKAARYWRIELNDTQNPAGYVQAGRLFIGPAWQPIINMSYGSTSLGWETKTDVQEAIGGAEYFQRRTPYRVQKFELDWMSQDEAFSQAFELQRQSGIDQEILFIHDTADTVHALRRRFLARQRTLGVIEYPYLNTNKSAFELKELL